MLFLSRLQPNSCRVSCQDLARNAHKIHGSILARLLREPYSDSCQILDYILVASHALLLQESCTVPCQILNHHKNMQVLLPSRLQPDCYHVSCQDLAGNAHKVINGSILARWLVEGTLL